MAALALDRETILRATAGSLVADAPAWPIGSVAIDSRKATPGCLFVALPGANTDGHRFVVEAVRSGARAVLVRCDRAAEVRRGLAAAGARAAIVAVEDTLRGLHGIAEAHLGRLGSLVRIGVTGSAGKTTTKEAIGAILAQVAPTMVSEGNLNSEFGLPLAVLAAGPEHRFGVFELAIDHPGEMDALARLLRPHVAVITNIGTAHSGRLGPREAIAAEKKRIFSRFSGTETALLWEDEPFFAFLAEGVRGKVVAFGERSTRGYRGSVDLGLDGTAIDWEGLQVHFPLFGRHNLINALAAASVAVELGVGSQAIKAGLERVRPLFARSQVVRGPHTLLLDCYNSNPESLAAVLAFVRDLRWGGRKLAVLGSMLELGPGEREAHAAAGRLACASGLDRVFLFGAQMQACEEECRRVCPKVLALWTQDIQRLAEAVRAELRPGDLVLIKGSRGMALERLVELLA